MPRGFTFIKHTILSPVDSAHNLGVIFDKKIMCLSHNISLLFANHDFTMFVAQDARPTRIYAIKLLSALLLYYTSLNLSL